MLANFLRIAGGMIGLAATHVILVHTILIRPGAGMLGFYHLMSEALALPWYVIGTLIGARSIVPLIESIGTWLLRISERLGCNHK